MFLNCLICSLGQHFTDIKGSKFMLILDIISTLGQQDIRKLKTNAINITFMFNISLYTYIQIKRFGSPLSHHQCEMLEENLTQVTGYGTAHILQTIQV